MTWGMSTSSSARFVTTRITSGAHHCRSVLAETEWPVDPETIAADRRVCMYGISSTGILKTKQWEGPSKRLGLPVYLPARSRPLSEEDKVDDVESSKSDGPH